MSYDAVQEGTVIARNVSVRVDQADPLKGFTASRRPSLSVRGTMQILTQQHSTANSRYQGAETAHRKETPRERSVVQRHTSWHLAEHSLENYVSLGNLFLHVWCRLQRLQ